MIETYNAELDAGKSLAQASTDPKRIKWSSSLTAKYERKVRGSYSSKWILRSQYRPFTKQHLYGEPLLIHRYAKMGRIFPSDGVENLVIQVSGIGARAGFAALMSDSLPDLHTVDSGQCFPFFLYEPATPEDGLFATGKTGFVKRDGITNAGLLHFQAAYPSEEIGKEDLFYYVYGLLHSFEYRERFKNNLAKELPRIPTVKTAADFWAFSNAGRTLGDLHVNYETVEPYPVVIKEGDLRLANIPNPEKFYRVEKMKFGGKGKEKDKTTVHYNPHITMTQIPLRAYDYVVNGKSALDWVMERQCVKVDKDSGIENDANRYAVETVGNPAYPLELFQRVITVSLKTLDIVERLPALDID